MANKRLNGEGSIVFHKGRGTWVMALTINGKRIFRYGKTRAIVKAKLNALRGIQVVHSSMRLKDYLLNTWLPTIENGLKTKTYIDYRSVSLKHLIPRLGHIKLKDIRVSTITKTWNKMISEGHSAHVVQSCQRRLSIALTTARKDELIPFNPCIDASVPQVESKEMKTLSPIQRDRVFAYIKDDPIYQQYYYATHALLHTGMRRNEMLALRWSDIDTYLMTATVNRSMYVGKGGEVLFVTPKTKSGRRTIKLTPQSCMGLNEYKALQGEVKEDSLIFNRLDTGRPILPNTLSHAWRKVVRSLNAVLEEERENGESNIAPLEVRLHDLRHTHATTMFKANINDKIIQ